VVLAFHYFSYQYGDSVSNTNEESFVIFSLVWMCKLPSCGQ